MAIETPTPTQKPDFDLSYSIEDFLAGHARATPSGSTRRSKTRWSILATEVPGGRVLDVACGTGKVSMRIAERGCVSIGAEASMEMIGLGPLGAAARARR